MRLIVIVFCLINISTGLVSQELSDFTDDRDGHVYKTVKIGEQIWMAENLAFKPTDGNYWAYKNKEKHIDKYGYLYSWKTAAGICPANWKLASKEDFEILKLSVGGDDYSAYQSLIPSGNSGFNALFGGYYQTKGPKFRYLESGAHFWLSTEENETVAWHIYISSSLKSVGVVGTSKNKGFSVRCIKK